MPNSSFFCPGSLQNTRPQTQVTKHLVVEENVEKKFFVRTNYGFDMFLQQNNFKQSGWRFFQDEYAPKSQTFLSCPKSHQEAAKTQLRQILSVGQSCKHSPSEMSTITQRSC